MPAFQCISHKNTCENYKWPLSTQDLPMKAFRISPRDDLLIDFTMKLPIDFAIKIRSISSKPGGDDGSVEKT